MIMMTVPAVLCGDVVQWEQRDSVVASEVPSHTVCLHSTGSKHLRIKTTAADVHTSNLHLKANSH